MLSVLQQLTSIITPVATKDGSYFSQMTAQKEADAAILRTMPSGSPTTAIDIGEAMGRVAPHQTAAISARLHKMQDRGLVKKLAETQKKAGSSRPRFLWTTPMEVPECLPKK